MEIKSLITTPLFENQSLQNEFETNGYVKLSLLNENEICQLIDIHSNHNNKSTNTGFHISLDHSDKNLVRKISAKIEEILTPKVLNLLDQGKIFTSSYTVKEIGNKFIVPPHQDWTFVDEAQYSSATLWIPLQDVSEKNGALGVIKGSHNLFNHHRSSPSPHSRSPLTDHIFTLFPFIKIIDMKAGEALIFNNKLIHASPPNISNAPRLAVGIGITQKEASLIHYYKTPKKETLEKYEIDREFFYTYNNPKLSDLYEGGISIDGYKKIKTIEKNSPEWSKKELENKIKSLPDVQINERLMNNLALLFNYDQNTIMEKEKQNSTKDVEQKENAEWRDPRGFFQKYTIPNIIAEIKWRINGRK